MELRIGHEKAKAKDFMELISRSIESMRDKSVGDMAYAMLSTLFDILAEDDKDFGYIVSYQSEETPFVDDIMFEADAALFRTRIENYSTFDGVISGYMTRKEIFEVFWATLAQQILMGIPVHDFYLAKSHVENSIMTMFNGLNRAGLDFTLRYGEKDVDTETIFITDDLSDHLNNANFNF